MSRENEYSPRGMLSGYAYAEAFRGDPFDLKPLVDGEIPRSTIEAVTAQLGESDDPEDPTLFWDGFRRGIAGWLVDQGITKDTPRLSTEQPEDDGLGTL